MAWAYASAHIASLAANHPKSLAATVSLGLAGFAATAFGVAPMTPDPSLLPKTLLQVDVETSDIPSQLEALAGHDVDLHRNEFTRAGDTADTLLARLGVSDPQAAAFLRGDPIARRLLEGRAGKRVQARVDSSGRLEELVARYGAPGHDKQPPTQFTRLRVERIGDLLVAYSQAVPLAAQAVVAGGSVRTTLFAATDDAGIPDAIATQLAEIFANDIDFRRDLKKGATFSVVYEALTADGEPVTWGPATGRVLGAQFINRTQTHSAMWFQDAGKGAYFGLDGESKQRAFLASPLEFSRVTSGFAMRVHPIFNTWKQHNGVDYAAPHGTPVRTVGDGVVEFAGWQNGYGNVVHVKHSGDRTTVYAHLSRVDVAKGEKVEQGGTIGTVGATGWATGAHLHFEVKIDGVQQDPLLVAQTSEGVLLSPAAKAQLLSLSQSVRAQLGIAQTLARAQTLGE